MRRFSSQIGVTLDQPKSLFRYYAVRVICLEIQLFFLTGALSWLLKLLKPPLRVAWIHIKICTLQLSCKRTIKSCGPSISSRHDKVTSRNWHG
ncbi:hypothetical protein EDC54_104247 [Samsonia erythrinae]|uniref:Uncharacterized protein n=1 Tax=Samsonia erythrinae TaxID=160434 RepID=A0A4R3VPR9_9GAMM|nr:hypothetical protein EDC54_104247 [Samsonia erythrinae]